MDGVDRVQVVMPAISGSGASCRLRLNRRNVHECNRGKSGATLALPAAMTVPTCIAPAMRRDCLRYSIVGPYNLLAARKF